MARVHRGIRPAVTEIPNINGAVATFVGEIHDQWRAAFLRTANKITHGIQGGINPYVILNFHAVCYHRAWCRSIVGYQGNGINS